MTRSRRAGSRSSRPASRWSTKTLAGKDWVVGDFSLADAALVYPCLWAAARRKIPLPANLQAHCQPMMSRPAVIRALKDEGL
jgi:glutathione S-transferase